MRAPVRAEINAGPLGRGAGCALRQPGCPFELPRYVAGRAGPARLLWLAWLVGQPTPARLVRLTWGHARRLLRVPHHYRRA